MGHILSSNKLINQADTSVTYPDDDETSVFTDDEFYSKCGKSGATGTIQSNGCAIVALAMYMLHKGGLSNTNSNQYYAVEQSTINATTSDADCTHSSFSGTIGSQTIYVSVSATSDMAAQVQNNNVCFVKLEDGGNSHYVLVDGYDNNASGIDYYLCADPDGGAFRTLRQVMSRRGMTQSTSTISAKYVLG